MSIIYGELTTRHRFHRDSIQPETERFPVEVMREAIVNMLMHRDDRHGQFTQIIRYDNRIEICNSGCSLKPDDMLGMKGSVTRNDTIARVCHDTKLAETKGSGIDHMWRKMVEAGLSRPTMESDRAAATFTIRLLLCHFFSEEKLDWLKRFAVYELNDNQRTALVFLLISFDSHGKMMLSPKLSQEVIALLGLSGEVCLRNLLSDRQEKYLRYHRENVFQSTSVRGMTRTMQKIPSISAPSRFVV